MATILADLKTVDAYSQKLQTPDSVNAVQTVYRQAILKAYKTNQQAYDRSVAYYLRKPKLMDSIFNQAERLVNADIEQLNSSSMPSSVGYFNRRMVNSQSGWFTTKAGQQALPNTYDELLQEIQSRPFYARPETGPGFIQ